MKYQGKHLYVYFGINGFIINLEFDFKGKARNIEWDFFFCSVDLDESKGEADLTSTEASDVEVSREEIRQGKSKKFAKVDNLLKELREGDSK